MSVERVDLTVELLDELRLNIDDSQHRFIDDWRQLVTANNQPIAWISYARTESWSTSRPIGCAVSSRTSGTIAHSRSVAMSTDGTAEDLFSLLDASRPPDGADAVSETWFRGSLLESLGPHIDNLTWLPSRSILMMEWPSLDHRPLKPLADPATDSPDSPGDTEAESQASSNETQGCTIASLEPGDEEKLAELNNAAFAGHPDRADWDKTDVTAQMRIARNEYRDILVARLDGEHDQFCGFAWTRIYDASNNTGEIQILGVHPQFSARGIGRKLLSAAMSHLVRERHMSRMVIYVDQTNTAAIGLYKSMDFAHSTERLASFHIGSSHIAPNHT